MIDMVVHRKDLKSTVVRLFGLLTKKPVEPIMLDYKPEAPEDELEHMAETAAEQQPETAPAS